MKQHNVLFSGKTLGFVLALFVQLVLSQTVFAQKAQLPIRQLGSTTLLTVEQLDASFVSPSVSLTRIEAKLSELYAAEKSGVQVAEKILFYTTLQGIIASGTSSIYNALGDAANKAREGFSMSRSDVADLKNEARLLLAI